MEFRSEIKRVEDLSLQEFIKYAEEKYQKHITPYRPQFFNSIDFNSHCSLDYAIKYKNYLNIKLFTIYNVNIDEQFVVQHEDLIDFSLLFKYRKVFSITFLSVYQDKLNWDDIFSSIDDVNVITEFYDRIIWIENKNIIDKLINYHPNTAIKLINDDKMFIEISDIIKLIPFDKERKLVKKYRDKIADEHLVIDEIGVVEYIKIVKLFPTLFTSLSLAMVRDADINLRFELLSIYFKTNPDISWEFVFNTMDDIERESVLNFILDNIEMDDVMVKSFINGLSYSTAPFLDKRLDDFLRKYKDKDIDLDLLLSNIFDKDNDIKLTNFIYYSLIDNIPNSEYVNKKILEYGKDRIPNEFMEIISK